jgi:hypothetical protein
MNTREETTGLRDYGTTDHGMDRGIRGIRGRVQREKLGSWSSQKATKGTKNGKQKAEIRN